MNQNDIRRIYTEKVAGLLAKGYVLHPETMGGSQGEMARIDLTNGSEILRVLINRVGGCSDSYGEIYAIIIGRCTEKYSGYQHTIWNDRLEILSEIKLDQISDNFYTTPEEGECRSFASAGGSAASAKTAGNSVTLTNRLPFAGCAASPA